ncbi:unnamed protein product [Paramecium octaurelia]|uniref:Uncharacterized protein n=1 Tax=Paramecium octaurelia TaxID=43137 RepID=A0A8S1USC2_PAROT|nr:unnamed protein product [Paramecium octaurelia]
MKYSTAFYKIEQGTHINNNQMAEFAQTVQSKPIYTGIKQKVIPQKEGKQTIKLTLQIEDFQSGEVETLGRFKDQVYKNYKKKVKLI